MRCRSPKIPKSGRGQKRGKGGSDPTSAALCGFGPFGPRGSLPPFRNFASKFVVRVPAEIPQK